MKTTFLYTLAAAEILLSLFVFWLGWAFWNGDSDNNTSGYGPLAAYILWIVAGALLASGGLTALTRRFYWQFILLIAPIVFWIALLND